MYQLNVPTVHNITVTLLWELRGAQPFWRSELTPNQTRISPPFMELAVHTQQLFVYIIIIIIIIISSSSSILIQVVARFKAWVCSRLLAGTARSNLA